MTIDIQRLRKVPEFEKLPDDSLKWLIDRSEIVNYAAGDYMFKSGDTADYMRVILSGRFEFRFSQNGQWRSMGFSEPNTITGLLPYSRMTEVRASSIALQDGLVMLLHRDHFVDMIRNNQPMTEALVHKMTSRVREFTRMQEQNEKLVSLGKLSAGLAHELNNPAAAIVRSSSELKKHLTTVPDKFKRVISMRLNEEQVDAVNDILFCKIDKGANRRLSLSERTEQEDEIADFLEDNGVEDGYEFAEAFVDFNVEVHDLENVKNAVNNEEHLPAVYGWLNQVMTTEKMVKDIEDASKRISELVSSVKSYTHMDRAPEKEYISIFEGIDSTITMLNHKLKKKSIAYHIDIPQDLPDVCAFGGELNQLWTNLIDNAVDAMDNGGTINISAEKDREFVLVYIQDNGSGIPEEIQSQIFDPFFTTKKVGEGTGLGLDVVKRIIDHHNGSIKVKSEPGETIFTICIPIND